jgi:hypothetical protein
VKLTLKNSKSEKKQLKRKRRRLKKKIRKIGRDVQRQDYVRQIQKKR